jgi:hypothetical protein
MSVFRDHAFSAVELLDVIPEELLSNLSRTTKVDHYTKVLHGKKLFYLLMFGILENDRLSQRSLEDTFNDPVFKLLFDMDADEKIRRSSISERLSVINSDYFKLIYEDIYARFSQIYSVSEMEQHNLIRVDSTMVSESVGKLSEGLGHKIGKKAVKYSISFDGLLPCDLQVFTASKYASEDMALPEVIFNHVKKDVNHQNIYLIDRGLQSTKNMSAFSQEKITFVCRAKENRKHVDLESFLVNNQNVDFGDSILIKDSKIQLYRGEKIYNKQGKTHYKETLVDEQFRLVIIQSKTDNDKQFWFLTNDFNLSAQDIAKAYRRRWDIEVFFRFIKQELNVSHLVSLNKNGMQVMIYMTMIVAMLILIYKKENKIGYKTAKRRFSMEIRNIAISMIVIYCGGDPKLFFKT